MIDARLENAKMLDKGRADLLVQNARDELTHGLIVGGIRVGPTAVDLRFMHGLGHVAGNAGGETWLIIGIQGPGADKRLVQQVFVIAVRCVGAVHLKAMAFVQTLPKRQGLLPFPGISDSTLSRAGTSSLRLVSCVEDEDMA